MALTSRSTLCESGLYQADHQYKRKPRRRVPRAFNYPRSRQVYQLYLGLTLLNKLKSDVSGGTLAGDYAVPHGFIRPQSATLWWTMVELIPSLYVKMDNGSLVIRTSEDTTGISQSDLTSRGRTRPPKRAVLYVPPVRLPM
jgi:hypothetical protein